ncbi:unnamed protein product [Arabidopsis halleri]
MWTRRQHLGVGLPHCLTPSLECFPTNARGYPVSLIPYTM